MDHADQGWSTSQTDVDFKSSFSRLDIRSSPEYYVPLLIFDSSVHGYNRAESSHRKQYLDKAHLASRKITTEAGGRSSIAFWLMAMAIRTSSVSTGQLNL